MAMTPLVFLVSLRSDACPGETVRTEGKKVVANDAAHCARSDGVIGAHCSYATGIMARRILEQGEDTELVATLVEVDDDIPGGVSAPYRLAEDPKSRVIANELIRADGPHQSDRAPRRRSTRASSMSTAFTTTCSPRTRYRTVDGASSSPRESSTGADFVIVWAFSASRRFVRRFPDGRRAPEDGGRPSTT